LLLFYYVRQVDLFLELKSMLGGLASLA